MSDAFMSSCIYFCINVLFWYSSAYRKHSLSSKFKLDLNSFKIGFCIEVPKALFLIYYRFEFQIEF
jgi:hypothetical protein